MNESEYAILTIVLQTARRTFIDNTVLLVLEGCLIYDLPQIFSPSIVFKMKDDLLEEITSEPSEYARLRQEWSQERDDLNAALVKCKAKLGSSDAFYSTNVPEINFDFLGPSQPSFDGPQTLDHAARRDQKQLTPTTPSRSVRSSISSPGSPQSMETNITAPSVDSSPSSMHKKKPSRSLFPETFSTEQDTVAEL
jgi:hypothetical protein